MEAVPVEVRLQAYALQDSGLGAKEVARRLKVSIHTIYTWNKKKEEFMKRHGGAIGVLDAAARRGPGRPPKVRALPPATDLQNAMLVIENEALKKTVAVLERRIQELEGAGTH